MHQTLFLSKLNILDIAPIPNLWSFQITSHPPSKLLVVTDVRGWTR